MKNPYGSEYLGSNNIETSVANQEIIPESPSDWTVKYSLYKLSLINYQDTNIIINGKTSIYLKAEQGFESEITDPRIYSFVIVDAGVDYQWIGAC